MPEGHEIQNPTPDTTMRRNSFFSASQRLFPALLCTDSYATLILFIIHHTSWRTDEQIADNASHIIHNNLYPLCRATTTSHPAWSPPTEATINPIPPACDMRTVAALGGALVVRALLGRKREGLRMAKFLVLDGSKNNPDALIAADNKGERRWTRLPKYP